MTISYIIHRMATQPINQRTKITDQFKPDQLFNIDSDTDSADSDSEFQVYQEWLDITFPRIKFSIALNRDELYETVSTYPKLLIQDFTCFCYNGVSRDDEFITVHQKNGKITWFDILKTLEKVKFDTGCDHAFLEGIDKTSNKGEIYQLCFGS